ncbi:MAG: hypothetical protein GXP15_08460 [Gammaproteobacteria bacterium]|nr:hypothetical protein [Gammaproteobacteria bacterium]
MTSQKGSELDLRAYLNYVNEKGKSAYLQVEKSISPRWETTAVVSGLANRMRSPVVYFSNVKNSTMPVVSNVCCSIERVANSVGRSGEELNRNFSDSMENLVLPEIIHRQSAPVREITVDAEDLSLGSFPQFYYTATQSHPYITAALIVARDPDSGAHNISFHRLMICSDNSVAIFMTPDGHLDQIWRKNVAQGRATPLSAVIGVHPLWSYASLVCGALDHDDYSVLGAVLGEAIQLTHGTIDEQLLVPARAEIVLEGQIEPSMSHDEGPFGEFLGYVASRESRPVIHFQSMSTRKSPIYQDVVAGGIEHLTMSSIALRARLHRNYFSANAAITDFLLPAALTLFLAIDETRQPDFDAGRLMKKLLDEERYLKQVVCFDSGVDLRKQSSVQSAMACHVQPDRDIRIIGDYTGNGIDPSEVDGKTAKMAIDARIKTEIVRNELPEEFLSRFDLSVWTG